MFANSEIKQAMTAYLAELSEDFSDHHLLHPIGPSTRDTHTEVMIDMLEQLRESVLSSRYPESTVLAVCKVMSVDAGSVEADSIEVLRACREWSLATIAVYQAHVQRLDGREVLRPFVPIAPIAASAAPSTPLISEVIAPFLADKQSGKPITQHSLDQIRYHAASLVEVLGDVPVGAVSYDDVTRFRDVMIRLPKRRTVDKRYKSLGINEMLALDISPQERVAGRLVKEMMKSLNAVWKWLVVRKTVPLNPFDGVAVATATVSFKRFTDAQVEDIFSSPLYSSVSELKSTLSHWWLLLMSLCTGARPSELVRLTLDDVVQEQGVLVMRIVANKKKGQSVKTKAGQRIVPVHPQLLELGFAEFVEAGRTAGKDRVLHGVPKGKQQAGQAASMWFKRYRNLYLPELKEQGKPLYSFRSTFVTHALNVANIDLAYVQQTAGHERSQLGVTAVYDAVADAKRLFKEMKKVKFKLPTIKPVEA